MISDNLTYQVHPALDSWIDWGHGGDMNGTCSQGEIRCRYADLVSIFGEPNAVGDDYKVDAAWSLTFRVFGTPYSAMIYNYKTGKNYLGEEGLPVEQITEWHINGFKPAVVSYIASMIIDHLTKHTGELLAALKQAASVLEEHAAVLEKSGGGFFTRGMAAASRAVIAKAEGRS